MMAGSPKLDDISWRATGDGTSTLTQKSHLLKLDYPSGQRFERNPRCAQFSQHLSIALSLSLCVGGLIKHSIRGPASDVLKQNRVDLRGKSGLMGIIA
eukprot:scaffold27105_cov32-Tisochrysis_lutea.AAC.1